MKGELAQNTTAATLFNNRCQNYEVIPINKICFIFRPMTSKPLEATPKKLKESHSFPDSSWHPKQNIHLCYIMNMNMKKTTHLQESRQQKNTSPLIASSTGTNLSCLMIADKREKE
jgi:hypothetical protein